MNTKTETDTATPIATETFRFQTEDRRLLDLVIHSLYSDKDIFLRELISNASDAIAKAKYFKLQNDSWSLSANFEVVVTCDPTQRFVKISDNGVGMTRQELIDNLGTIARSGTSEFLNTNNEQESLNDLIGKFGVGFYSVFMVADKVDVISRSATSEEAWNFSSEGQGEFSITPAERSEPGTTIIAHMKDDEYLHPYRLKGIIEKYSHYAPVAVYLESEQKTSPAEGEEAISSWTKERVNETQPLWLQSKNNINEESYHNFYKELSKDYQNPLSWLHGKIEGSSDYHFLLYLPEEIALFAWQYQEKPSRIKLHVKHIFITDDSLLLLPRYLSFISGVVDFQDLPLNVSRELLQEHKIIERSKTALTKKVLAHLEDLNQNSPEKYLKFWTNFGQILKMFPAEDPHMKETILPLLRFPSTQGSVTDVTSLAQYVERMPEEQKEIYYITASTWDAAKNSPHMDYFKKKGWEVLLLIDRVDESLMNYLQTFENKDLRSITASDLPALQETTEAEKEQSVSYQDLCNSLKGLLTGRVKDVKVSSRLVDSPCCLVVDNSLSLHMQRLLKEAGQALDETLPILEINPDHPMVTQLKTTAVENMSKPAVFLYSLALLAEGGNLSDPASFSKDISRLLNGIAFIDL